MSWSGSGKPDPDLEGVELLFHQKGGSTSFGAKVALSLSRVDPSCINSITWSTCRAKRSNILHDTSLWIMSCCHILLLYSVSSCWVLHSLLLGWVSLCRMPLCRIPIYQMPLCRMPLCWMPLCWMPLCQMPLCRMQLCRMPFAQCHYARCHGAWYSRQISWCAIPHKPCLLLWMRAQTYHGRGLSGINALAYLSGVLATNKKKVF